MGRADRITRRNKSPNWYARIWVPLELQHLMGTDQKWRSLGTSDLDVDFH